ncbi:hypothetical protein K438DRAFT_813595 [Mycena galopus ATCC 62051]|nr:hypothetical protein K438DRAFT_813595 [Mycena galopus ATCC 62051]
MVASGLKTQLCGLVGGRELLTEWEREWAARFGGPETDEVSEGDRAQADDGDGDEDEDESDDEGGGRKRKKPKVEPKPKPERKAATAAPVEGRRAPRCGAHAGLRALHVRAHGYAGAGAEHAPAAVPPWRVCALLVLRQRQHQRAPDADADARGACPDAAGCHCGRWAGPAATCSSPSGRVYARVWPRPPALSNLLRWMWMWMCSKTRRRAANTYLGRRVIRRRYRFIPVPVDGEYQRGRRTCVPYCRHRVRCV